jgi:hypothetical protein
MSKFEWEKCRDSLNLTRQQEDAICYIIGEWYLSWKNKITYIGGEHKLGIAKENLKSMICNVMVKNYNN